jgi:hypothetical protein
MMYFIFINENRRMKPVEIVLRKGEGDEREWWRGLNLTIVSTYVNTTMYNYYVLIK